MAEKEGFEPSKRLPPYLISSQADSAALALLHGAQVYSIRAVSKNIQNNKRRQLLNNTANNRFIFLGFIAAGLTNIFGMLAASEFFTNTAFHKLSPEVFSDFGTFMVMVWGLAYLAVARQAHQLPAICFVFAFEKAIYVYTWVVWISSKSDMLPILREETPLLALFYSGYGLIDLAYALFFAWVGIRALQK